MNQLCNWPFEVLLSGSDVKDSDMSSCEDSDGMQYLSSQIVNETLNTLQCSFWHVRCKLY